MKSKSSNLNQYRTSAQLSFPLAEARSQLLTWYHANHRILPWRSSRDPWAIWVSEIMLQQTRVSSVLEYFDRFMLKFPTVCDCADASWEDLSQAWAGLGYYRRAKHLHAAAQQVCELYDGEIPQDPKLFRALKGVGAYTAGAVLSIAFNQEQPIVDGNVARVFSRLYAWTDEITSSASQKHLWDWAQQWVVGKKPGDLNQALMELGATLCSVKNPQCTVCPLRTHCLAFAQKRVQDLPYKKSKKKVLPIESYFAIVAHDLDGIWVIRREQSGLLGGLWGLPLVPCSVTHTQLETWMTAQNDFFIDSNDEQKLQMKNLIQTQREITLEGDLIDMIEHKFTHKIWRLYLWKAQGKPQLLPSKEEALKHFSISKLSQIALDGPSLKGLRRIGYPLKARRGAGTQ
jgi:A/G-specific adenine glycosylase